MLDYGIDKQILAKKLTTQRSLTTENCGRIMVLGKANYCVHHGVKNLYVNEAGFKAATNIRTFVEDIHFVSLSR
ncbi:unnamed protein product [Heterobilharzia americana]|nr:unnamed protein product [Heterobilharzia americana]